jgi:predicted permease
MSTVLRDLRLGLRLLRKSPGFAAVIILTLGLGIGATSAIFSVVDGVLLRPLPYGDPDRLVMVWNRFTGLGFDQLPMSQPEFVEYREHSTVFEHMAAITDLSFTLTGVAEPVHVRAAMVTSPFFQAMGVEAQVGRTFTPDADQPISSEPTTVLSDRLWRRVFGADRGVIGRIVTMNGVNFRVVGVVPAGFNFPDETEVWVPLMIDPANLFPREMRNLRVVARLMPGVTLERAQAEMDTLAGRLAQQFPENYVPDTGWGSLVIPLQEQMVGTVRARLFVLLAAVGFLLLIACANVANLLLARAQSREREVAVRTALGASRSRLVSQFVTESAVLALLGGLLGLTLAYGGIALLKTLAPGILPRIEEVDVDARALLFALGLSLLTGLILGLVPALQSRADLTGTFKQAGGRSTSGTGRKLARRALVIAEMAVALVLVIGAVLMGKSFLSLQRIDPGFNPGDIVTLRVDLPHAKYVEPPQIAQFFQQMEERMRTLQGVQRAAVISHLPLSGTEWSGSVTAESQPPGPGEALPEGDFRSVSTEYFKTLNIPLKRGRLFTSTDHAEAPLVAVIDEKLAERYWPNRDPLGDRIKMGAPESPFPWFTIVGVVGNVKNQALDSEARVQVYYHYPQRPLRSMFLVARTDSDPARVADEVSKVVRSVDPDVATYDVATMEERLSGSLSQPRLSTWVLGTFAGLALLLATVGIYGVIAWTVGERTQELGVRMALGAQRGQVLRLVLRQGMMLALVGLAVGIAAAFVLTRWLSSQLYGVSAVDPAAFAGVALLLGAAALLATYLPARRATRVDPVVALRYE